MRIGTAVFFALCLIGCDQPQDQPQPQTKPQSLDDSQIARRCRELPFKGLGHASHQLLIDGWSQQQVQQHFESPRIKKTSGFKKPVYGIPESLPPCDEQWIYEMHMGHIFVFFNQGKVVLAVEEWSDF
ncbi:MAG TPA: hypothetical protein VM238_18070 [Phycisphaerae bacterium]|nr:hypothetical protein [Phycisphaerae bacterium]